MPAGSSAPADSADPMARSARMIGGEWRLTAASGESMYTTSHWGPGRHSVRSVTIGSEASGAPWRDLGVGYWHPGRREIRLLGVGPYRRSVSEGVIKSVGETSESVIDHFQIGEHRKLVSRTDFDGPDEYRATLLEWTSPEKLEVLTGWDIVRSKSFTPVRPLTAEEAGKPSAYLKALEPFLGRTWESTGEAKGEWSNGAALQSTFEWIPIADTIYARVVVPTKDGEPMHVLDAYLYYHPGATTLRCLALSHQGGVYEGDISVLDGGALQLDVKGFEGDRAVSLAVRFDFEADGALHQRIWSVEGAERTLLLDVHHTARADSSKSTGARERNDEPAKRDPYFTPTEAKSTASMPRVIIRNIREDRAGNVWFATFGGPIRYDGKEFTNFGEEVGLGKTRIFSLLEARSGALWFGSITGGATRYDGTGLTKFTAKDGLGNDDVMWIFEDRDGDIWLGTGNGVSRYDGTSMTTLTTKDGLAHDSVYAITQDASGRFWFGTQGGVSSFDGTKFSNLADKVGRSFTNVRAMVVDPSGNLWFGGQEGAFRYDGTTLTSFTSRDGLLSDFVGSMIVDRSGNIWFGHPGSLPGGAGGGASRYDGKSFTHFTQKDGLGSATVYAMLEDSLGNIWFGSADAGACRYDGKTFTHFSSPAPPLGIGK